MAKDLFPPEGENKEVMEEIGKKIQPLLEEISSYYKQKPKITLIIRYPYFVDADFIMSNDEDPQAACNSLMNLYRRSHPDG